MVRRTRLAGLTGLCGALALLAGCGGAASNDPGAPTGGATGGSEAGGTLVVWDFHSGDENWQSYYDKVEQDFEAAHDGVDVQLVAQPFDQYYTLIGTAIQSEEGPDLLMFNGGAQLRDRTDALLPLDDYLGDAASRLTGWDAFKSDDKTYGVPITVQGEPIYYNKAVFTAAGLDPESPPETWEDLTAACDAVAATDASCFATGNKEALGIEFWFGAFAQGSMTADEYDAWLSGTRDWESPNVRRLLETWSENIATWSNPGVNSTAQFMDSYAIFQRGEAANTIGLISDVAHWKDFEEFLGEDLGVYPSVSFEDGNPSPTLAAEGGVGYGVTSWTANPDLAAELALAFADTDAELLLLEGTGAFVADTTVDTGSLESPSADKIVEWLPDSVPLSYTVLSAAALDELHKVGQELVAGDITVDEAVARMVAADQA
jgi:multiple sugar transport system substrate-binding protein